MMGFSLVWCCRSLQYIKLKFFYIIIDDASDFNLISSDASRENNRVKGTIGLQKFHCIAMSGVEQDRSSD
jgi:hypothetical protein